jgi:hypothetical protein
MPALLLLAAIFLPNTRKRRRAPKVMVTEEGREW